MTKRFPGVVASDAVDLSVRQGEVHALLGENGAGKSTLVALLAGLQQPDAGEIAVDGQAVRIDSPRRALGLGIGTVFQHFMLVPGLTVAENLLLGGAWWRRASRRALRARFEQTCAAFGIDIDLHARAGVLSLGERQLVEIVRALWRGGRLLVLDEPTAMLTPRGIEELGRLMRRLAARGIGVVFITHKLHEALDYADRVTVLRRGRVAGSFTQASLQGDPQRAATIARVVTMMFGAAAASQQAAEPRASSRAAPVLEVSRVGAAHVSFAVHAGEIFGIAGIDGNGQTALAEILAGQRRAAGTVRLDGRDLAGLDVGARYRAGLRYATDDRLGEGSVGALPVAQNLLLKQIGAPPFWRRGRACLGHIAAHARRLMRDFDIRAPSAATPAGRLSGGNLQKMLLARELQGGARALICNKPTHGLDLRHAEATRARLREGAREGIATVLISNDLDELVAMSDRIGVMVRGRMVGIVKLHAAAAEAARAEVARLLTATREFARGAD